GIIGCGWILRGIYHQILEQLSEFVEVVALCDLSEEAVTEAGQLFPRARCYSSMEQMIDTERLGAAMVLTSECANTKVASAVLAAHVPVFLEKPPARNLEELEQLIKAAELSQAPLYAAYNRHHCPLLRGVTLPKNLRRVQGRMERQGREFSGFPFTALHLLDSLHYYTRSEAREVHAAVVEKPSLGWRLDYQLDNGCPVEMTLLPASGNHCETLLLEGESESLEIHFPNPESGDPEGTLIVRDSTGGMQKLSGPVAEPVVQMGYEPALRGFVEHLASGEGGVPDAYRIEKVVPGIRLMQALLDAGKAFEQARASATC
ncbi:MAG: Gfo/Idh/MocA family protein, partial [Puniceicoccales bacterium]